jgi:hypothetical protein
LFAAAKFAIASSGFLSLWRRCFLPRYYLFSPLLVPHQGFPARRPENGGNRAFFSSDFYFFFKCVGPNFDCCMHVMKDSLLMVQAERCLVGGEKKLLLYNQYFGNSAVPLQYGFWRKLGGRILLFSNSKESVVSIKLN